MKKEDVNLRLDELFQIARITDVT